MNILSPSILAADFSVLGAQIKDVEKGGAAYLHVDVMDGIFVPSISFGMPVIKSIRRITDIVFDVHLMIKEPVRYIKEFKECGADIITVHYEACEDVAETLRTIRAEGLKAGLSIKPATDPEELKPYLPLCDMVLLMSVEPGFGGQLFMEESYERASRIRRMIDQSGFAVDLEIDGGITLDNVKSVLDSGVNVIVTGSAVFRDPYTNTVRFMEILGSQDL